MQDDMMFGSDCSWLHHLVALYKKYPQMGAMGHKGWCDSLAITKICTAFR
jgi:hypothetical protein